MAEQGFFSSIITKARTYVGWNDEVTVTPVQESIGFSTESKGEDLFKAYIPWFLYKPPFGFPRQVNVIELRSLARNPYIFSIIKTLQDEISSIPYRITLKQEYIDEGYEDDPEAKKDIVAFFRRPNNNKESFEHIIRTWIRDICEVDAAIGVKVFDSNGKFKYLFARDGGTFLKNPDIFGTMQDRVEFVTPPTTQLLTGGLPGDADRQIAALWNNNASVKKYQEFFHNQEYADMYKEKAAYFQYGFTAGARPVPFGTREIMYIMANPRSDSIYGRSPIEILHDTILTLIYGGQYNLDFYLNNNTPAGFISIPGAKPDMIDAWQKQMEDRFMSEDALGHRKKKFFRTVFTNEELKHIPIQLTSKDMEVIEQQKWFTKLAWACFGVTPTEMGFTEDVNRATAAAELEVSKQKAIKPLLSVLKYHINTFLMPEFGHPEYEFTFEPVDIVDEKKRAELNEILIRTGVKTANEIREAEYGLDPIETTDLGITEGSTEAGTPDNFPLETEGSKEPELKAKKTHEERDEMTPYEPWVGPPWTGKPYSSGIEGARKSKKGRQKLLQGERVDDEKGKKGLIRGIGEEDDRQHTYWDTDEEGRLFRTKDMQEQMLRRMGRAYRDMARDAWYTKQREQPYFHGTYYDWIMAAEDVPDLEKDLNKQLTEAGKQIEAEVLRRMGKGPLSEIKGFVDTKSLLGQMLGNFDNVLGNFKGKLDIAIREAADKGLASIEKQINRNIMLDPNSTNYIAEFAFENLQDVNKDLTSNIRKQVQMGILNKESEAQIKARIWKEVKKAKIRTSTIIRTETTRARAIAEDEAARKAQEDYGEKYQKEWVAKVDARTCPNCLAANGKKIPMNQDFKSTTGDVQLPPMHPNCRCRIVYVDMEKEKE